MSTLDTSQPFSREAALEAGIADGQLRGPAYQSLFRGVYVASTIAVTLPVRARAALLLHPAGAVVGGHAAAELLGLPVPQRDVVEICVDSAACRRPRPGLRSTVHAVGEVGAVDGLPVATGAPLFLQLAPDLGLVDLVVLGDAMVRRALVTPAGLVAASESARGRGVGQARRAAALVRPRVDSAMETRARLLLVLAGFPEPMINPTVAGRFRPDLCWNALRLVVEYDGRQHRDDLDRWDHDINRNEWFARHGWVLVHLVARDIFQRPGETIRRVRAAWDEQGGMPFRPSEAWRAHFQVAPTRDSGA